PILIPMLLELVELRLIASPQLSQSGGRLLLTWLGDVRLLNAKLRLELRAKLRLLGQAALSFPDDEEHRGAVDSLHRFFHPLGGQHAAEVVLQNVLPGLDEVVEGENLHRSDQDQRDGQGALSEKELGSQLHRDTLSRVAMLRVAVARSRCLPAEQPEQVGEVS